MQELLILFLYHALDATTKAHFEKLQALHSEYQIVPIAYRFQGDELLPGTVDVGLEPDHGWPIERVWREVDKVYLRWYLGSQRPKAKRYVFFEYDILANCAAASFFGPTWNSPVAVARIKTPDSNPGWPWWGDVSELGAASEYRCGVLPLAATLWSDEALAAIAHSRLLQSCFCELRMGTLAKMYGFEPQVIPGAERTISWKSDRIQVTDELTWFHPVKG